MPLLISVPPNVTECHFWSGLNHFRVRSCCALVLWQVWIKQNVPTVYCIRWYNQQYWQFDKNECFCVEKKRNTNKQKHIHSLILFLILDDQMWHSGFLTSPIKYRISSWLLLYCSRFKNCASSVTFHTVWRQKGLLPLLWTQTNPSLRPTCSYPRTMFSALVARQPWASHRCDWLATSRYDWLLTAARQGGVSWFHCLYCQRD